MMMTEDQFWQIIESAGSKAKAAQGKKKVDFETLQEMSLREVLLSLTPEKVQAFDLRMRDYHIKACRWDIWGAAYWLNGGCSDDGFSDFRYRLLSLGKEFYHRILENPDVLVETIGRADMPYMQCEGFGYVPMKVYEELTGRKMPDLDTVLEEPENPRGVEFTFDDPKEMARRFPRLVERLPQGGK